MYVLLCIIIYIIQAVFVISMLLIHILHYSYAPVIDVWMQSKFYWWKWGWTILISSKNSHKLVPSSHPPTHLPHSFHYDDKVVSILLILLHDDEPSSKLEIIGRVKCGGDPTKMEASTVETEVPQSAKICNWYIQVICIT